MIKMERKTKLIITWEVDEDEARALKEYLLTAPKHPEVEACTSSILALRELVSILPDAKKDRLQSVQKAIRWLDDPNFRLALKKEGYGVNLEKLNELKKEYDSEKDHDPVMSVADCGCIDNPWKFPWLFFEPCPNHPGRVKEYRAPISPEKGRSLDLGMDKPIFGESSATLHAYDPPGTAHNPWPGGTDADPT